MIDGFFYMFVFFLNKAFSVEGSSRNEGNMRTKPCEWLRKKDVAGMCICGDGALDAGFVVRFVVTMVLALQP